LFEVLDCGVGGVDGTLGAILAAIAIGASVFIAVAYVVTRLRDARLVRRLVRPYGALVRPTLPAARGVWYGVAEGSSRPSPLQGEPCLAYSMVLRSARPRSRANDVLWREATSTGFSLRLDDGGSIRIPAGRVRFAGEASGARRASRAKAAARLPAGLDVDVKGELSELPFDEAFEEIIRPNDRVAVLARIERREERNAPRASLRAPATMTSFAADMPVVLIPGGAHLDR
jgi:hypothetical protein